MRSLNSREKGLLALLVIGGGAGWYFFGDGGVGLGGPAANEQAEQSALGKPPLVRMDLLRRASVEYDPKGRNLFKYYVPPRNAPPPPPPPPRQAPPPTSRPKPPPRPKPAPPKLKAPAPDFRYLGFLGPKERKVGAFDGGDGLTMAGVGDVVEEDFLVLEFKFDKVVFGYTDEKFKDERAELTMSPKE